MSSYGHVAVLAAKHWTHGVGVEGKEHWFLWSGFRWRRLRGVRDAVCEGADPEVRRERGWSGTLVWALW